MHIVEFIGRLLLSALFLIEGFGKISMQENVIMYMEDYGVPGVLFVPAIVLEILFPLLLIVGYKTKWADLVHLGTYKIAMTSPYWTWDELPPHGCFFRIVEAW